MSTGRRLFDYDPVSRMSTWFEYDPITKTSILIYEQDVEDAIDVNTAMSNDRDYSKRGIRRDWWHYAHIPDAIAVKMMTEEGINIYSGGREDMKRAFDYVNRREHRRLKTTELAHSFKE
jgi:hypothetical protein